MKRAKILSAKDLCLISLFVALITVCSFISIPLAMPVTMQIFGVFLACAYLGLTRGLLCVLSYVLLGVAGVPVFSNFRGGINHLFTPSGGFIIGFLLSGLIIGFLLNKKKNSFKRTFCAMVIALFGCYIVGAVWMLLLSCNVLNSNNTLTMLLGLIPLLFIDLVKVFAAALLSVKLKKLGDTAIK